MNIYSNKIKELNKEINAKIKMIKHIFQISHIFCVPIGYIREIL